MIIQARGVVKSTGAIGIEIPVSGAKWHIKNLDFGMVTKTNVFGRMAISILSSGTETYLVNGHQISDINPSINIQTDIWLKRGDKVIAYITGAQQGNEVELDVFVEEV